MKHAIGAGDRIRGRETGEPGKRNSYKKGSTQKSNHDQVMPFSSASNSFYSWHKQSTNPFAERARSRDGERAVRKATC